MVADRVEDMDVDTCLELLEAHHFGRIAVNDAAGPVVFPVNYVLDQGTVLFRSDEGTKLSAAMQNSPASFEIDAIDERTRTGWSVVVRGKATEVHDPSELRRVHDLPLHPFAGGEKKRYVRLLSSRITGRRIAIPEGVPTGWFRPTELGNVWLGVDGDDLGV